MGNFINRLLDGDLEHTIDKSRQSLLLEDEIYIRDRKDKETLERRYEALSLDIHDRLIINDLIACTDTMHSRVADISYIAGVSDTLKLLNSLGMLEKHK